MGYQQKHRVKVSLPICLRDMAIHDFTSCVLVYPSLSR